MQIENISIFLTLHYHYRDLVPNQNILGCWRMALLTIGYDVEFMSIMIVLDQ